MEFSPGALILAVVGSGAVFTLWTYLLTQRFNAREALRTAYVDYLAAVELVARAKIKNQAAVKEMRAYTEALGELVDNKQTNQPHADWVRQCSDMKQHVDAAQCEVLRTGVESFNTRAAVDSAENRLRLLETDDEFDQKVQYLSTLLADLIKAKANDDTKSKPVNQASEDLVVGVRTHHPRLAVHSWAARWRRFWGYIRRTSRFDTAQDK